MSCSRISECLDASTLRVTNGRIPFHEVGGIGATKNYGNKTAIREDESVDASAKNGSVVAKQEVGNMDAVRSVEAEIADRTLQAIQASGLVPVNATFERCRDVTVGPKVFNIHVDNREKVKGRLLGVQLEWIESRTRVVRFGCVACSLLAVAIGLTLLAWAVVAALNSPPGVIDLGLDEEWYVRREQWLAADPRATIYLRTPVRLVVIGHSVTQYCSDRVICIKIVRAIQNKHIIDRRFDDIASNFLVGGMGWVLEGRGANVQGEFLTTWNAKIISVIFLGDYQKEMNKPDMKQVEHLERVLSRLVELNVLSEDYELVGSCQLSSAISPGFELMQAIGNFSHWSPRGIERCPGK